jgi:hypothetical protein
VGGAATDSTSTDNFEPGTLSVRRGGGEGGEGDTLAACISAHAAGEVSTVFIPYAACWCHLVVGVVVGVLVALFESARVDW